MANVLGITAFNSEHLLKEWWEWTLLAIIIASGLIGIFAFLKTSYTAIRQLFRVDKGVPALPYAIQEQIHILRQTASPIRPRHPLPAKPTSFGVYLGPLSTPTTKEELDVLTQWEAVVLDYGKPGVMDAINDYGNDLGPHLIARLDLLRVLNFRAGQCEVDMLPAVYLVSEVVRKFLRRDDQRRYFTGVLVAGWCERLSVPLLNGLAKLLAAHGLDVFLEIGPPDFLNKVEKLNLKLFAGIVVRNGTILPNGERRDFFAMDSMKSTTKAFVSESCMRPFMVMMWDTVDGDAELSHAVARRAHMWCSYHGAIPFVAREGALTDLSHVRSCEEPLAAFQWLKNRKVMAIHERFRSTRLLSPEFSSIIDDYLPLHEMFPQLGSTLAGLDGSDADSDGNESSSASTLTVHYPEIDENGVIITSSPMSPLSPGLDWSSCIDKRAANPLSCSFSGSFYGPLGCFPIGLNASQADFDHVLTSQRRLRNLNLLSKMSSKQLHATSKVLRTFALSESRMLNIIPSSKDAIFRFADALSRCNDEIDDIYQLQVYTGLDSGFHTPTGGQFWAIWEIEPRTSSLVIYLSKSVQDVPSALLHTYLSKSSFSRYQCFLAEYGLAQFHADAESLERLPTRMDQDLNLLSCSDLLLQLQHLQYCEWDDGCPLLSSIQSHCEELLIDVPTYRQLKKLANMDYISGAVTDEALVHARLKWYRLCDLPCLDKQDAVQLFRHIDYNFGSLLWYRDHENLDVMTAALEKLTSRDKIDSVTDFVLFCIFCAARKAAFEEVYIEVSDRNPLFNQYSDQSAAFAELFALGSRCEAYFDITPSDIGILLSKRHRDHYNKEEHQPPMWIFNAPSFASAYAAAQTDIDPDQKQASMPGFRRFTFLSVFAIPALVDIMLLTSTGHGLYLSAFMTYEQQKYATLALMASLLLSSAIGTWISIGGTYYLISMAFSAANMFVLTRLIGGLAFTAAASFVGFIVISAVVNVQSGAIFFFYLLGLTSYLSVLAVLSTYQVPGSAFLNGRKAIILLIPTLVISPLITTWIPDYDIIVYPCVLYLFVTFLILGTRHVGMRWVTWYHNIKTLNDKDIKDWYIQAHGKTDGHGSKRNSQAARISVSLSEMSSADSELFYGLSEPAILALCRKVLHEAVMKEKNRNFWQKSTKDAFVKELAGCWDSTIFLLDWYSRLTETKRPIPYSSTWNLETQVALESMQQSQKGIKLHNSFIHWRNAGDEIGCGILYFLVALMDRWLDLLHGGHLVGLSAALNQTFRLSVGFGLAYYLIGAVLLDYKAQHLHTLSEQSAPVSIESIAHIRKAKSNDKKFRRLLYWKTMGHFIGVHVWALSLSAALIWIFNGSSDAMIMFLAYVGAYTGLLLYQYNKIFSGPHALMPLLSAVVVGFVLGVILKRVRPRFEYDNVIALAVSTWTAAFLSFHTAKLGLPEAFDIRLSISEILSQFRRHKKGFESTDTINIRGLPSQYKIHWSTNEKYHAYNGAGTDEAFSQSELAAFVDKLRSGPKENRFRVSPFGHPGDQITAILLSCTHDTLSRLALQAFPAMPYLVQRIVLGWQNGIVKVFIVPMQSVVNAQTDLRAISHYEDGHLNLYMASDSKGATSAQMNVSSNCQAIAETLIHTCSQTMFGMPKLQADVTESILMCKPISDEHYVVSECTKRSMPFGATDPKALIFETACRKELLQHLCLGYDCDFEWDQLPLDTRKLFLRRCLGARGPYSNTEMSWINSNVPAEEACTILSRIARYDLGAFLIVHKYNFFNNRENPSTSEKEYRQITADIQHSHHPVLNRSAISIFNVFTNYIRIPVAYVYHTLGTWIKFFVLAAMADSEYQRELNGAIGNIPRFIAKPVMFLLTGIWIYSRWTMSIALPFFLYHRRPDIASLSKTVQGSLIAQKKDRLIIRSYGETETAFVHPADNNGFKLVFYQGIHKTEPQWGHTKITAYSKDMRVVSRTEYKGIDVVNEFVYDYPAKRTQRITRISKVQNGKIPVSRHCVSGNDAGAKVQYNFKGHIESGSYLQHGNLVRFKYHYRKNAKYDDELLRAEFVLPHMSANVSWCAPPIRHAEKMERWIPTPRVHEATFVQGADVYECSWLYDHKFHPTITTKLNGEAVNTPDMIRYDWLGVLKKPTRCTFTDENPLLEFKTATSGFFARLFRTNVRRQAISTSRARSQLWKAWKKRNDLDGVVIRWVDEELLRKEALLNRYWRRRDRGSLLKAEDYLALHADAVMASSDLTSDISAWTPLAVRMSDLFSFGQGGDAVIFTRTKSLARDTDSSLHVIAVDTGTWPNEGGGVSACRRDLINNLRTIKWHMVVESANDFGLPKHQTEENVESLKIIPLWGLDFMHPCHGMFTNKLDSEVDHLVREATLDDIRINFIPTLTALVRGARAITMTAADVKQATRALVNLNSYFQDSRHWKEVWTSDIVKDTWRKLWLADDMPNAQPPSEWFKTELPTLGHFDTALELWFRYLFIFSIPIPEKIPSVFQASHHSVSASYGIVCKIKRNCTLQIWDHAISWRETNLYLSSAMCTLPPFIRNSLLGLMKLTSCLILHHADQILPCADFFNPGWEVEIGSAKGQVTHRNVFRRKVDPIVNGITDMQKFSPVTEIKTKTPTVTMLSHVWFAKDIKTALLAADIISNEWGFKDYKLDIYGALNKSPVYSSECQEILACKGLGQSVALRGAADPGMVLSNTWLFLNSSVSEGLPLALGEAALTGAPVVCTDVGASLRVLTDPDDGKRYSEVVAPNDAYGLARAQINLLAMLDEWAQYADDDPNHPAPVLPHKPTPKDVEIITQRMYDKTEHRRKLGMMARNIVQKSFGGERYLREHEQMLWIGKACYDMLGIEKRVPPPKHPGRMLSLGRRSQHILTDTASSNIIDPQLHKMQHPRPSAARHLSTTSSFSSIYIDQLNQLPAGASSPSSIYGDDWGPTTPDSSVMYAKSEKSDFDDGYFVPSLHVARPQRIHARPALAVHPPGHVNTIAMGKRPVQYGYGYGHAGGFQHVPASHVLPKVDPRRNLLARQAIGKPESIGSSVRTRSHLNEVITADYALNVDGRL
ncbi:glycosyltransferase family 4 protein [Aaosphaeria arxii CBS 175.79]|uniref:Glycosyltransferase family 4 protein n=1 Tax=Aaosphaeria arxii CBS 175.79 TaxID=1450172 RepID=A0A6A5XY41_9PLEO|nr:glycosyltransferase family 4 protein [Aaosphaeria arxii CBS 175.79]KAF2017560.1 glycosyltransferase family 4 protein [Aaosphaeria arxii CBS 175.79]